MITSIQFSNFKALDDFSIALKDFNVLTGPNNSGKSTILDSLRILQGAYRYAARLNPQFLTLPSGPGRFGYEIPNSSIPVILENLQTDLNTDEPAKIKYRFSEGQSLTLAFNADSSNYLYFETPRKEPRSSTLFRKEFPVNISVIPTLGPFSVDELIVDPAYVQRWYGSRRSPRLFRNHWYYNPEGFDEFKSMVRDSWPGMSVTRPTRRSGLSQELVMFCEERRFPREICWAGFGFQIWLQLLTHILKARSADLLVVDEPEIYLHPDLQHKILDLLRTVDSRIILATHSVELINSVDPSDVLLVDKNSRSAKRIGDLEGLQMVSNLLGSGQNMQLTRLARGKKILFVEGQDAKLLARLAKVYGKENLFTTGEITSISIDGFSNYEKVTYTNWAFTKILGENISICVLLDRDYRSDEEVEEIQSRLERDISFAHILERKEIENYFIVPNAIERAINLRIKERSTGTANSGLREAIGTLLSDITDLLKVETLSQQIGQQIKDPKNKRIDPSTITKSATQTFEEKWIDLDYRFRVVSGKTFFALLNQYLQENYSISITLPQIAHGMKRMEIDNDLSAFLLKLEAFRTGNNEVES